MVLLLCSGLCWGLGGGGAAPSLGLDTPGCVLEGVSGVAVLVCFCPGPCA